MKRALKQTVKLSYSEETVRSSVRGGSPQEEIDEQNVHETGEF